jgi:hypothetical protein
MTGFSFDFYLVSAPCTIMTIGLPQGPPKGIRRAGPELCVLRISDSLSIPLSGISSRLSRNARAFIHFISRASKAVNSAILALSKKPVGCPLNVDRVVNPPTPGASRQASNLEAAKFATLALSATGRLAHTTLWRPQSLP